MSDRGMIIPNCRNNGEIEKDIINNLSISNYGIPNAQMTSLFVTYNKYSDMNHLTIFSNTFRRI
jgi:hypothetical protein